MRRPTKLIPLTGSLLSVLILASACTGGDDTPEATDTTVKQTTSITVEETPTTETSTPDTTAVVEEPVETTPTTEFVPPNDEDLPAPTPAPVVVEGSIPGVETASEPNPQQVYPERNALTNDVEVMVGQGVNLLGNGVVVKSVSPQSEGGINYIVADVEFHNLADSPIQVSYLGWAIENNGAVPQSVFPQNIDNLIQSGELAPGQVLAGEVWFEVGEGAGTPYIAYTTFIVSDQGISPRGVWAAS